MFQWHITPELRRVKRRLERLVIRLGDLWHLQKSKDRQYGKSLVGIAGIADASYRNVVGTLTILNLY
jgi:hypothetical protein